MTERSVVLGPLLELQLLNASKESGRQPLEAHEGLRVLFAGNCQQRLVQEVALHNAGDTVLFFQWHRVERDNSLGRHEDDAQRFFLDCEGGRVVDTSPGDVSVSSHRF